MTKLKNKEIVLGVSGGIAAYKAVELLRLLVKAEARVRVVMTASAQRFVGPITFSTLSGRPVLTDLFDDAGDDAAIRHIEWAAAADAVVVAPATANLIGKLANGIADDALSTFLLAVTAPVFICPAMNTHMYEHRAVQRNIERLEADGCRIIEPDAGQLACGTVGPGRLPDPEFILESMRAGLTPKDFSGKSVLVTAGPTHEPIDPVRFITNPSSGKMGFAIARAAAHRGARVTLVTGPVSLADPLHVEVVRVRSAEEMASAVFSRASDADIVIKTAAVSDFRPCCPADHKIKKSEAALRIDLTRTTDILLELGKRKRPGQRLVGFAAETREMDAYAEKKLTGKNLDMVVANLVNQPGCGFATETNTVTLFSRTGEKESVPAMEKTDLAHVILDRVLRLG